MFEPCGDQSRVTSRVRARARLSKLGYRARNCSYLGITRSTCVCWSMISDTSTRYASVVARQGRSRRCSQYQASRRRWKRLRVRTSGVVTPAIVLSPRWPPQVDMRRIRINNERMANRLPLEELHRTYGAAMEERSGWSTPAQYGDVVREHTAVRTGAGVIDRSFVGKATVTGRDRQAFLQGMLTNDVKSVPPGQSTSA